MKTIQQRLQSRISLRRNVIRELEDIAAYAKIDYLILQSLGAEPSTAYRTMERLKESRQLIKVLAADQKLDKELHTRICLFGA